MFNPHFLTTYPQSHISQPRNLPHSTSATDGKKHPRISKATLSDVQPTHPHNSPTFHNLATYHTQPVRLTIRSTHASSQHFLMFNPHFLTTYHYVTSSQLTHNPTLHNLATYHTQPVRLTARSTHASSQHFLMFNPHILTTYHTLCQPTSTLPHNSPTFHNLATYQLCGR